MPSGTRFIWYKEKPWQAMASDGLFHFYDVPYKEISIYVGGCGAFQARARPIFKERYRQLKRWWWHPPSLRHISILAVLASGFAITLFIALFPLLPLAEEWLLTLPDFLCSGIIRMIEYLTSMSVVRLVGSLVSLAFLGYALSRRKPVAKIRLYVVEDGDDYTRLPTNQAQNLNYHFVLLAAKPSLRAILSRHRSRNTLPLSQQRMLQPQNDLQPRDVNPIKLLVINNLVRGRTGQGEQGINFQLFYKVCETQLKLLSVLVCLVLVAVWWLELWPSIPHDEELHGRIVVKLVFAALGIAWAMGALWRYHKQLCRLDQDLELGRRAPFEGVPLACWSPPDGDWLEVDDRDYVANVRVEHGLELQKAVNIGFGLLLLCYLTFIGLIA